MIKVYFDDHIFYICKKSGRKISTLARVTTYIRIVQKRILLNVFPPYFPTAWMCHGRGNSNKINRLYKRCLQIVYNDKQSSFNELHLFL